MVGYSRTALTKKLSELDTQSLHLDRSWWLKIFSLAKSYDIMAIEVEMELLNLPGQSESFELKPHLDPSASASRKSDYISALSPKQ